MDSVRASLVKSCSLVPLLLKGIVSSAPVVGGDDTSEVDKKKRYICSGWGLNETPDSAICNQQSASVLVLALVVSDPNRTPFHPSVLYLT